MQQRTKYHEHHQRIKMFKIAWSMFFGVDITKIKHQGINLIV